MSLEDRVVVGAEAVLGVLAARRRPARVTASISAAVVDGRDQRRRWPSARRRRLRPSSTPRSSASRMVRSTRTGDIGWRRPEVVLGERRVEHDRRGCRRTPCGGRYPPDRRSVPRTELNMFSSCATRSLNTFKNGGSCLDDRCATDPSSLWLAMSPLARAFSGAVVAAVTGGRHAVRVDVVVRPAGRHRRWPRPSASRRRHRRRDLRRGVGLVVGVADRRSSSVDTCRATSPAAGRTSWVPCCRRSRCSSATRAARADPTAVDPSLRAAIDARILVAARRASAPLGAGSRPGSPARATDRRRRLQGGVRWLTSGRGSRHRQGGQTRVRDSSTLRLLAVPERRLRRHHDAGDRGRGRRLPRQRPLLLLRQGGAGPGVLRPAPGRARGRRRAAYDQRGLRRPAARSHGSFIDVAEPFHDFGGQFFRNAADPRSPALPLLGGVGAGPRGQHGADAPRRRGLRPQGRAGPARGAARAAVAAPHGRRALLGVRRQPRAAAHADPRGRSRPDRRPGRAG